MRVQRQNALILRPILRLIVVVAAAAIAVLLGVGVMAVSLVPAFLLVLADFVLDYLISAVLLAFGDPPVFLVVVIFLETNADLLSIPTVARRGGLPPGGRACGAGSPRGSCSIRRSRGARACGLLACPEGISVF